MCEDIIAGEDILGVLLMGNKAGSYWYGSKLSIEQTRKLVPDNSATTLQVTCSVMAGVIYAIENPNLGLIEPEEMDHERILELTAPYLGEILGVFTDWTPLYHRLWLFDEDVDEEDEFQFKNFLI